MKLAEEEEGDQRNETLRSLLQKLPSPNRATLYKTMDMCSRVAENSDFNKMSPSNLAIVIAPNILRNIPTSTIEEINRAKEITTSMIENFSDIFGDEGGPDRGGGWKDDRITELMHRFSVRRRTNNQLLPLQPSLLTSPHSAIDLPTILASPRLVRQSSKPSGLVGSLQRDKCVVVDEETDQLDDLEVEKSSGNVSLAFQVPNPARIRLSLAGGESEHKSSSSPGNKIEIGKRTTKSENVDEVATVGSGSAVENETEEKKEPGTPKLRNNLSSQAYPAQGRSQRSMSVISYDGFMQRSRRNSASSPRSPRPHKEQDEEQPHSSEPILRHTNTELSSSPPETELDNHTPLHNLAHSPVVSRRDTSVEEDGVLSSRLRKRSTSLAGSGPRPPGNLSSSTGPVIQAPSLSARDGHHGGSSGSVIVSSSRSSLSINPSIQVASPPLTSIQNSSSTSLPNASNRGGHSKEQTSTATTTTSSTNNVGLSNLPHLENKGLSQNRNSERGAPHSKRAQPSPRKKAPSGGGPPPQLPSSPASRQNALSQSQMVKPTYTEPLKEAPPPPENVYEDADVVCFQCNKHISGNMYTLAEDHIYHNACFACASCGGDLTGGYVECPQMKTDKPAFLCVLCNSLQSSHQNRDGDNSNTITSCFNLCTNNLNEPRPSARKCKACQIDLGREEDEGWVRGLGGLFHRSCFTCTRCKKELAGLPYIDDGTGQPFCDRCDPNRCAGCDQALGTHCVNALGRLWHQTCFSCFNCRRRLDDGYVEEQSQPYCDRCHELLFSEKCDICHQVLNADCVGWDGLRIHLSCFRCHDCGANLRSVPDFVHRNSQLFCSSCETQCPACHTRLGSSPTLMALGTEWHKKCFTCASCSKQLATDYFELHSRPYCEPCAKRETRKEKSLREENTIQNNQSTASEKVAPTLSSSTSSSASSSTPSSTSTTSSKEENDENICSRCNQKLGDKRIRALGKRYHAECFVCCECRRPDSLSQGFTATSTNEPLCPSCHDFKPSSVTSSSSTTGSEGTGQTSVNNKSRTILNCSGCGELMSGSAIIVQDQQWHRDCFVCSKCSAKLEGQSFIQDSSGAVVCESCSETEACAGCGLNLGNQRVVALKKKWHPDCFKCRGCACSFQGAFYNHDGHPYCENCLPT
eukprot:TRINITY_DN645_c0_g1_i1.p1 TRINITY_DN645_c0_g1~~TRINITY_DN645_c0_g1_i1.p1  ORF type:complete len:1146 (+),score=176.98 TRINITY_DN645_c0_g1_i1:558-3995(+)